MAAEAVQQVFAGRNLAVSLEDIFKRNAHVSPQQRAVAQDLSYGALRFYGEINALLEQLLLKPLRDQWLRNLLIVAIYQLQHGKASEHTVVDQAVKASAYIKQPWAKGLTNAVLRNFLRNKSTLVSNLSNNEVAQYSYPVWWVKKLKQQYPESWEAILIAGNQHPPMTLRINHRQVTHQDYLDKLSSHQIDAEPLGNAAITLLKPTSVDKIPGFFEGKVSVQDFGAQYAAQLLDVADGMRVLDACCAPGGKTGHILELADVDLLALDSDESRLKRVDENLKRLNLKAQLKVGDASKPDSWWDGQAFDRILADVPCTASGIVRRHVDIKWLRREEDIASFSRQQALILPALWQLLAKGGKLLYATCSIFHEENQRQIDNFLELQPDAKLIALEDIPQGQLLPSEQHDGFFYALLQKI